MTLGRIPKGRDLGADEVLEGVRCKMEGKNEEE
jgi:hypothetical protein